jgi:hypothetical protein
LAKSVSLTAMAAAPAAGRTIEIRMTDDMRPAPDRIDMRRGDFQFACRVAGHCAAGMVGAIGVQAVDTGNKLK